MAVSGRQMGTCNPARSAKMDEAGGKPSAMERGLKYFMEVLPGSAITRFSTQKWQEEVQTVIQGQLTLANFTTEQEARMRLQQQE